MSNEEASVFTTGDLRTSLINFASAYDSYHPLRLVPMALVWVVDQDSHRINVPLRNIMFGNIETQVRKLALLKADIRAELGELQRGHDWGKWGKDKLLSEHRWLNVSADDEHEVAPIMSSYWDKLETLYQKVSRAAFDFDNSDKRYIITTARPSSTVPGKVAYKTDPNAPKYTVTSYTKWLRRAVGVIPALTLDDSDIQILQDFLQRQFQPLDDMYNFQVVQGQELLDVYREAYFGSCMHKSPGPRLYRDNPTNVKMLTARDKDDGELVARALVWHTDQGTTVLDRVYPSDGGIHTRAMRHYAAKHGWYYKERDGVGYNVLHPVTMQPSSFTVTLKNTGYYPYMDTFLHVRDYDADKMVVGNKCEHCYHHLQSTENYGPNGPGRRDYDDTDDVVEIYVDETLDGTPISQRQIDDGEVTWVEYPREGFVFPDDAVWIPEHDFYASVHSPYVEEAADNTWIITEDTEYINVYLWTRFGTGRMWIHPSDVVEGPGGQYHIKKNDIERFCDREGYELNDDNEWVPMSEEDEDDDAASEVAGTTVPFNGTASTWAAPSGNWWYAHVERVADANNWVVQDATFDPDTFRVYATVSQREDTTE